MYSELKMASAHEKIMRRHFRFIAKIIRKSPCLSPERMMMGSPKLIWRRDDYKIDLKPNTWNPAFGKTIAMYLEDRAIQLYIYAIERKQETDLDDPKSLIRAMLSFEGTQAEMNQTDSWMEFLTYSKALWERVVQYGQFQPINSQETVQERRTRISNTFAMEIPKNYIKEHGGRRKLLQIIRNKIEN